MNPIPIHPWFIWMKLHPPWISHGGTAKDLERTDELLEETYDEPIHTGPVEMSNTCIVHDVVDIYIYIYTFKYLQYIYII